MTILIIGSIIIVLEAIGIVVLIRRIKTAPAALASPAEPLAKTVSAVMATHARMLEESLKAHIDAWGKSIRTDVAKLIEPNPAAPTAPNAATPPAPAPATAIVASPSADSGGTDPVAAKRAALKAIIDGAKHAQSDATARLAAIDAKRAELDALVN